MIKVRVFRGLLLASLLGLLGPFVKAQDAYSAINQSIDKLAEKELNCYQLAFTYYDGDSKEPIEQSSASYHISKGFQSVLFEFDNQLSIWNDEGLIQIDRNENYMAFKQQASGDRNLIFGSRDSVLRKADEARLVDDVKPVGAYWELPIDQAGSSFEEIHFWIGEQGELLEIIFVSQEEEDGPPRSREGES